MVLTKWLCKRNALITSLHFCGVLAVYMSSILYLMHLLWPYYYPSQLSPFLCYGMQLSIWFYELYINKFWFTFLYTFIDLDLYEICFHLYLSPGYQWRLNQLMLFCTDKDQDCFLIADRFQLMSWLSMPYPSLSFCSILSCIIIIFYNTLLNYWTYCFGFFVFI